jgi:hypothetical protein
MKEVLVHTLQLLQTSNLNILCRKLPNISLKNLLVLPMSLREGITVRLEIFVVPVLLEVLGKGC